MINFTTLCSPQISNHISRNPERVEEIVFPPPSFPNSGFGAGSQQRSDSVATAATAATRWEDFCAPESEWESREGIRRQREEVVRRCEARGWGREVKEDGADAGGVGGGKGREREREKKEGGLFGLIQRRLRD